MHQLVRPFIGFSFRLLLNLRHPFFGLKGDDQGGVAYCGGGDPCHHLLSRLFLGVACDSALTVAATEILCAKLDPSSLLGAPPSCATCGSVITVVSTEALLARLSSSASLGLSLFMVAFVPSRCSKL